MPFFGEKIDMQPWVEGPSNPKEVVRLNLMLNYINAKIEYEFAKRGGNLFLDLNDSADALKEAERELRESY